MRSSIGDTIYCYYLKIEKRFRVCYYSALICGLMAHIYAMTNHLYNYDELWHTPAGFGTGVQVGRWALSSTVWIQKLLFEDCYTIPLINGLITIILYAIAACFVVAVGDIKDTFFAGIVGALMTTFPALTCRMFYMFTTHYYAIGIAMVAAGVWILLKKKHNVISIVGAFALVTYGMAIYQANFVTAVCMVVMYLMVSLIKKDMDIKTIIRSCVNCVMFLGLGMALFLVISKIALAVTGLEMETYENLDKMGTLSFNQLIVGIIRCYKSFFKIPFIDVYSMNPNRIVKLAFLVAILSLFYVLIRVWQVKKDIYSRVFFSLIVAILPIAINLIIVMAISSGTMYSIMVYEIVFMMIIPVACLEALKQVDEVRDKDKALKLPLKSWINIILSVSLSMTVASYIWFANGNYLALEYTNNHDNAYYMALMTQIKSIEGYKDTMPVATVGYPTHDITNSRQDMIGETFDLGGKAASNVAVYSSWNIMTRVLGFDPLINNSDEYEEALKNNEEVINMPNYPSDGSIKIIDDTIVIKFQDFDELELDE